MSISSLVCTSSDTASWLSLFCSTSDTGVTYVELFTGAVEWTLLVSLYAWLIAMVIGVLVGIGLTSKSTWIRTICILYTEVFRNIPLLVQLFLWYYVIPHILPGPLGRFFTSFTYPYDAMLSAVLCLGLFTSVRIAIQLSSGIRSLPRGQSMAATALGLKRTQMYRYVLLPVAFRIILPPTISEMLNLLKNSSVASVIGLIEITGAATSMAESTFQIFPAYIAATVLYIVINLFILFVMSRVERWVQIPGFVTSK
ncbi:amino acid ABC transporter permease [Basilea psittacipulmonis]|uniref:Glutamate ABC transporter permease n=1 Tax=Basilea psittacipulmonis DSM 24701 TaxID=1072685 RepID=A0A077DGM6_9BURK|nr:amino acid ABC transporter permease [Basilea psittacipulmonis]AIL33286.1 glutamate ABC transporter permease [Basilea psittacipulmonis DSM 24701]